MALLSDLRLISNLIKAILTGLFVSLPFLKISTMEFSIILGILVFIGAIISNLIVEINIYVKI